jgi:hypothetical protein
VVAPGLCSAEGAAGRRSTRAHTVTHHLYLCRRLLLPRGAAMGSVRKRNAASRERAAPLLLALRCGRSCGSASATSTVGIQRAMKMRARRSRLRVATRMKARPCVWRACLWQAGGSMGEEHRRHRHPPPLPLPPHLKKSTPWWCWAAAVWRAAALRSCCRSATASPSRALRTQTRRSRASHTPRCRRRPPCEAGSPRVLC